MENILKDLKSFADEERKKKNMRFFKTGPGQYGHGDKFIGVSVPHVRKVAKNYQDIELKKLDRSIQSKIHEERLCAIVILNHKFLKANEAEQKKLFNYFKKNIKHINNWDLVDTICPRLVSMYLYENDRKILYTWVKSKDLWIRRISIMGTFYFIKQNDFKDTVKICKLLLKDEQDLIHKACGWLLREIGKKDLSVLRGFLREHSKMMPRTMLRYSIEKLSASERKKWMTKD